MASNINLRRNSKKSCPEGSFDVRRPTLDFIHDSGNAWIAIQFGIQACEIVPIDDLEWFWPEFRQKLWRKKLKSENFVDNFLRF